MAAVFTKSPKCKGKSKKSRGKRKKSQCHFFLSTFAFLLLFALAGCGPKLEFAEVSGKVTLNKKPVAGVFVQFYPLSDAKEQLPSAIARTDAQGNYTLTHDGDKPGALVGPNRVVVFWPSRDLRGEGRDGKPLPPPSPAIPVRYTVVTESTLDFEVKAGPPQTFDIRLQD
jgi:hypothetical protein